MLSVGLHGTGMRYAQGASNPRVGQGPHLSHAYLQATPPTRWTRLSSDRLSIAKKYRRWYELVQPRACIIQLLEILAVFGFRKC